MRRPNDNNHAMLSKILFFRGFTGMSSTSWIAGAFNHAGGYHPKFCWRKNKFPSKKPTNTPPAFRKLSTSGMNPYTRFKMMKKVMATRVCVRWGWDFQWVTTDERVAPNKPMNAAEAPVETRPWRKRAERTFPPNPLKTKMKATCMQVRYQGKRVVNGCFLFFLIIPLLPRYWTSEWLTNPTWFHSQFSS